MDKRIIIEDIKDLCKTVKKNIDITIEILSQIIEQEISLLN